MPDDFPADDQPEQGRISFQDESTTPREPTLAERKAREQAERRRAAEEQERETAAEKSRKQRKRLLIGGGVTVGLAAVIGIGYAISQSDEETARCTDDSGIVVDEANCVTPAAASSGGGYYGGGYYGGGYYGGGAYPVFIGGGGRQYHYTYGGSGNVGQPVSGGTTTVPKDSRTVRTPSGRTISGGSSSGSSAGSSSSGSGNGSVTRGGLGSSSSSSGSSGKSSGS